MLNYAIYLLKLTHTDMKNMNSCSPYCAPAVDIVRVDGEMVICTSFGGDTNPMNISPNMFNDSSFE